MANERYAIRCPVCSKSEFVGKTLCDGLYTYQDESKQLEDIYDFIWDHLSKCRSRFMFDEPLTLFEIIPECHPDYKNRK